MSLRPIGQPVSRVDGRAKVTGEARYAGEWNVPGLLYGVVVSSEITRGRILRFRLERSFAVAGVVQIFTHENRPDTAKRSGKYSDDIAPPGKPFRPLHDADIHFAGQPIALVVADTFEAARAAAAAVEVDYERASFSTDLPANRSKAFVPKNRMGIEPPPKPRGHAEKALGTAVHRHEAEYTAPAEHHNPMEPFAATVVYDERGKLFVYEKTQGVQNDRRYLAAVFDMKKDDIELKAPFVGGGFGSGLRPQYQLFLAVMAARELRRSVRVTLTRQQMFTLGHRPASLQPVSMGADAEGRLVALTHDSISETSQFEQYSENVVAWTAALYSCPNVRVSQKVVALDTNTPVDMRAPGAAWGLWALESAMDELAFAAKVDPLEFRLRNYAEKDESKGHGFSSKELRACYRLGAERFGWAKRSAEPRSMREGHHLIGWGHATGVWEANQMPANARAILSVDGRLTVSSGTTDIGPGTYTAMTQIAADAFGLPMDRVTFRLGEAALPFAPVQGGSFTAATVGSAVKKVCEDLRSELLTLARKLKHPALGKVSSKDALEVEDGFVRVRAEPSRAVPVSEVLRLSGVHGLEKKSISVPNLVKQSRYTRNSHAAVFVEVRVDERLGIIEVTRVVSAVAAGRILNPKTARSQILGGVVWGIGMALHEHSMMDTTLGRYVNPNLAEYHVPVNADIRDIDILFVDETDDIVNPLGVKGIGELGIVGVAAAVANAVFHATGVRVRSLPITLDKVLSSP